MIGSNGKMSLTIFRHMVVWALSTDLPYMKGNHDYIFGFLQSVCYAFGHLYHNNRQGVTTEALMEECTYDAAQAAYHPKKELNQAIVKHLIEGNLHENLDSLQENSP